MFVLGGLAFHQFRAGVPIERHAPDVQLPCCFHSCHKQPCCQDAPAHAVLHRQMLRGWPAAAAGLTCSKCMGRYRPETDIWLWWPVHWPVCCFW